MSKLLVICIKCKKTREEQDCIMEDPIHQTYLCYECLKKGFKPIKENLEEWL